MTYEEAIEYLKWKSFQDYSGTPYELAIEALKKQIPKKPIYYGDGYSDGKLVYDMAECPTCGKYTFEEDINDWGCNYCPECGQALDWE